MAGIPISDAHCHVNPGGLGGFKIASKFRVAGGWFIALVSLPPHYYGYDLSTEGMLKAIDSHVAECRRAREAGIKVACIAGMHPAVIDRLVRVVGPARAGEAVSRAERVIKYLRELRRRGVIDGFGEFGRPHYKTLPESVVANEVILTKVFEVMEDEGGVIHLHLEQGGALTVHSVHTMLRGYNVRPEKVVFHHSTVKMIGEAVKHHYAATLTGRRGLIKAASRACTNAYCMIESDYIDDPSRPGAVMYPWEIAEEVSAVISEDGSTADAVVRMLVDNVVRVYDLEAP